MGVALASGAAAALGLPEEVWAVLGVFGVLLTLLAVYRWLRPTEPDDAAVSPERDTIWGQLLPPVASSPRVEAVSRLVAQGESIVKRLRERQATLREEVVEGCRVDAAEWDRRALAWLKAERRAWGWHERDLDHGKIEDAYDPRQLLDRMERKLHYLRTVEHELRLADDDDDARDGSETALRAVLVRMVQRELVAIIDDGEALASSVQPPRFGEYRAWCRLTATFLGSVFGLAERQRFGDPDNPSPDALSDALAERLRRLRELRDRPESWELRVDEGQLSEAMAERRTLDEGDRIVTAERRGRFEIDPELVHALEAEVENGQDIIDLFADAAYDPSYTAVEVPEPMEAAIRWATRVERSLRESALRWLPEFRGAGFTIPDELDPEDVTVGEVETMLRERVNLLAGIVRVLRGEEQARNPQNPDPRAVPTEEAADFKRFAHKFAGWWKGERVAAPPDMTEVLGADWEPEHSRLLSEGLISPQEHQRKVQPFTERRQWAIKVLSEYHRDWRPEFAHYVEWVQRSGVLRSEDVALLSVKYAQDDDLSELADVVERIADRL